MKEKFQRRFFLSLIFACWILPLPAVKYKILYLNSTQVLINGHQAMVGQEFDEQTNIDFRSDSAAIKALNLENKRVAIFSASAFKRKRVHSITEYFASVQHLSTRSFGTQVEMTDTIVYVLDTLCLPRYPYPTAHAVARMVWQKDNQSVVIPLKIEAGYYKVPRKECLQLLLEPEIVVDIMECDTVRRWDYKVYSRLPIVILPM